MRIERVSPVTGQLNVLELDVTEAQLKELENGAIIQRVLSHLTDGEREFIISGCTKEDWDYIFDETD
jgi:hypothetical protein